MAETTTSPTPGLFLEHRATMPGEVNLYHGPFTNVAAATAALGALDDGPGPYDRVVTVDADGRIRGLCARCRVNVAVNYVMDAAPGGWGEAVCVECTPGAQRSYPQSITYGGGS